MNKAQAINIILNRWEAQWPGLSSSVPYVLDNEAAPAGVTTYARLSVRGGRSERATIGASPFKKMRFGTIDVKLIGPADAGRIGIDILGQHIKTIFEEQRISFVPGDDIVCLETTDRETPDPRRPNEWCVMFSTEFWFSEAG